MSNFRVAKKNRRGRKSTTAPKDDSAPIMITEGKGLMKVTFGSVQIRGGVDTKMHQANVVHGHRALERAKDAFLVPGVKLTLGKEIPRYSVDRDEPHIIIRSVGGKVERGKLINGKFETAE